MGAMSAINLIWFYEYVWVVGAQAHKGSQENPWYLGAHIYKWVLHLQEHIAAHAQYPNQAHGLIYTQG